MLRCIAVDDEPLALRLVSSYIEQTPFLALAGSFSNAVAALAAIRNDDIQLVFLDIQMPDLNGIELARVLAGNANTPRIIFTTAFNNFAIEGYKVDALDYLLKPFSYEEFLKAATKAEHYFDLLHSQKTATPEDNFMFVKADYKMVRVDFEDVVYIESLKDYIKIHLAEGKKPILTLSSLRSIEEKLPPAKFIRIHRSFIVALDKIDSITKNSVHLGDVNITVGEQYKDVFRDLMNRWL
ncbi:LytR/AlgR family response regulator transcription factor [Taibaiella soli]|uniref:DNA-binding response regulator n=1 Tax=Taibaiella soli TaxID=1649169 RepID=A0A2W2AH20_9BACT|nr:LytTR family DNA-binding domain-containing protein [Taibaiella soli]PZF74571.1 DNA-binding response regulator [Taibaiella soli]